MSEDLIRLEAGVGEEEELIQLGETQRPATARENTRDTVFYSVATGLPVADTRREVEVGNTTSLEIASGAASSSNLTGIVEEGIESNVADFDEQLLNVIEELQQIDQVARFVPPSVSAALRAGTTGSREFAVDRVARMAMTMERLQERTNQAESGIMPTILDGVELLLDPFDLVHQATYTRLTGEYEALLSPTVSLDDFSEGLDRIITEAYDAGFFSDENQFFFGDFLSTLGAGTESSHQDLANLLGMADLVVTGAFDAIPVAARGSRMLRAGTALTTTLATPTGYVGRGAVGALRDAGRDFLSTLNLTRPSDNRDRIIQEVYDESVLLDDPTSGVSSAIHSHTSALTPTLTRGSWMSAPTHEAARRFELGSRILARIKEVAQSSGQVFDEAVIQSVRDRYVADRRSFLISSGESRVIDIDFGVDEFNNLFAVDALGTKKGGYFRTEANARRAAQEGDEVALVGENQYAIIRRHNVSADDLRQLRDLGYRGDLEPMMLYRATDPSQMGHGWLARYGSPGSQADPEMASNLFIGEGILNKTIQQINRESNRVLRGMRGREAAETFHVFEEMAGEVSKNAYTASQFRGWFSRTYNGRAPSDSQVALYLLWQERLDAEAFVRANNFYRNAVDMNARVLHLDGTEYVVAPISRDSVASLQTADVTPMVYTPQGVRSIDTISDDVQIYRTVGSSDLPSNTQFVVGDVGTIRSVRHSDFLVRNSGGHRTYITNEMQFLAKQENNVVYGDGTTRTSSPRTWFGARTSEEAQKGVEEVNNIIAEIRTTLGVHDSATLTEFTNVLRASVNNPHLNSVVRNNNSFDPSIQSMADLVEFVTTRGIDLRRPFRVVAEGDALTDMARLEDSVFTLPNVTHMDDVRINISRGGRGNLPLSRYGGGSVTTRSPRESIEGAYTGSLARVTEMAYMIRAGQGIIKAALQAGVLPKAAYQSIMNLPLRTRLERMLRDGMIDTSGATGGANVGRKLQLDLERTLSRLNQRSWTQEKWQGLMRRIGDLFYGVGWNKTANVFDRWSNDPLTALRGWAFDSFLGMFNYTQLLMQGAQVVNIVGVSGVKGIQGAALYGPVRFMLNNGHPAVVNRVAELIGKVVGLEAEDFHLMLELFKRSGRGVVDNNYAEMSRPEDMTSLAGRSGVAQQVRAGREAGRVFFKEGELVARITGFNTAYLSYIEKFGRPTARNMESARRWITSEEQRLTNFMTTASRQPFEQLPFMQFMSYTLRVNEALFAGTFGNSRKILSNKEKATFLATHLAMFGAMGTLPTMAISNYITNNYGVDLPEPAVTLARRGIIDTVIQATTGVDTAVSSRFSSSGGIYEFLKGLVENNIFETIGGPSGQLAGRIGESALGTIIEGLTAIHTGNIDPLKVELDSLVRTISTVNYAHNAFSAYRLGTYRTRGNNSLVTDDLTAGDAVALAFGIPLEEVDAMYSYMGNRRFRTTWLGATVIPTINENNNRMFEALRRDDLEEAARYYQQNALVLNALDPWERDIVDARTRSSNESMVDSFMIELLQRQVYAQELVQ